MEIRNDSTNGIGPKRIDFTKANRDAIREQAPSPPEPETTQAEASNAAKRVAAARDRFEAQQAEVNKRVLKRVQNARAEFSEAKRVHEARAEFSEAKRVREARAEFSEAKRVQAARKESAANSPEDKLTLSSSAKQLSDAALPVHDASVRAQRVSELKDQHQSGQLDVQSLVAEAAFRMLSAE